MTVSTTDSKVIYDGDGSTTAFPVTFPFFVDTDLTVILRESGGTESAQTLNTDYTVSGGNGATGTVTMAVAPDSSEKLVIVREIPYKQEIDYRANDAFPAETHEHGLDRAVMLAQQLLETVGRSPKLPISSSLANVTIPEPEEGRFLRGNATGDGFENAEVTGQGSIGLPVAVTDGGTGATAPAGARANLDAQEDVISARGDVIRGGATGAAERLALGAAGQVLSSDGTDTNWSDLPIATQAEMEAASAANRIVAPARQQHHPGHPKAWLNYKGTSPRSIRSSYNVAGVTADGSSRFTVSWQTVFSSGDAYTVATCYGGTIDNDVAVGEEYSSRTAGSAQFRGAKAAGSSDPEAVQVIACGDQ